MRKALVNEVPSPPLKGLSGLCRYFGDEMVSKCGDSYRHYWAHKKRDCDDWQPGKETKWLFQPDPDTNFENADPPIKENGAYTIGMPVRSLNRDFVSFLLAE